LCGVRDVDFAFVPNPSANDVGRGTAWARELIQESRDPLSGLSLLPHKDPLSVSLSY